MVMMMVMAADAGLLQILRARHLSGLGRVLKLGPQLVELIGKGRVSRRLRGLRGALQVGSDLRGYLLKSGRIGLLELLQHAHHHCSRRQVLRVGDLGWGRSFVGTGGRGGIARSAEDAANRAVEGIQSADRHSWLLG